MKRFFVLLMAFCLLAVLLCGCGKDKKKESSAPANGGAATVAPTPTPTPVPTTAKAARVTADDGLNVRSSPSTDAEILGLAEKNSKLALLIDAPSNGWYQVYYEGKTAYVYAEYAQVVEVTLDEYNNLKGTAKATPSPSSGGDDPQSPSSGVSSSATPTPTPSPAAGKGEDGE